MKRVIAFAFVLFLFVACNKNQSAVKKLDGTWTLTEMSVSDGGASFDLIAAGGSGTFIFQNCKLKTDEWCSGSSSITYPSSWGGGTEDDTFVYRVTGDGTMIETKETDTSTEVTTMTIIELTKTSLSAQQVDSDGTTTDIKADKQ